MALMIRRSGTAAAQPWPAGTDIQGSAPQASTAFVEVAVPVGEASTFMHVTGASVPDAESRAFQLFTRYSACEEHSFERGAYRNGAATCSRCGMWSSSVFEPLERCIECDAPTYYCTREGTWWCEAHADLAPRPAWLDDDYVATDSQIAAALPQVLDGVLRAARAEKAL